MPERSTADPARKQIEQALGWCKHLQAENGYDLHDIDGCLETALSYLSGGSGEAVSSCRTCGTPEPDEPCYDCGTVSPTHADQRETAALRIPPPPPEFVAETTDVDDAKRAFVELGGMDIPGDDSDIVPLPERSTADMPRTWTIYVCRNDRCAPAVKPGLCNCVKPNRVGHRSGITTYESREAVEVVESGGSGEVPARREVPAEDAQRPGAECWDTRAKLEPWEQEHAAVIADELTYVGEVPAGLTERALHQIDGALDALERGVIGPVTAVPAIRGALAVLSGGTTYAEVTHPKFSADELLVLQRAMAGVFLEEDAPLRDGILRRLAKEMVKRRRDA